MIETSGTHDRRNAYINVVEGGFWVAGALLMSPQTVLPALVTRLGGGNVAIGALGMITLLLLFLPQVIASRYGQTYAWKKPWVLRFGLAQRLAVFVLGVTVLLFSESHPELALGLFFILFSLNQLLTGFTSPVWFDLYAKLTSIRWRGRLTGARSSIAGTLAFIGGLVLTWILGTFTFPLNYTFVIFLAFVLQSISVVLQFFLVEEYPSRVMPRQSLEGYVNQLEDVVERNMNFRAFIIASMFLILAAVPMSFFTVYALKRFSGGEHLVGEFTLIMVVGQIVGSILNGVLADRYGNRLALVSAACAMLIASVSALLAPSLDWFRLVFLFMGMNIGSELMIRHNLAIECGPVEQRSTYIGLMNTILAPLYLFGLFAGWLIDQFGYHIVFFIGVLCSVTGIVLLIRRVQEPRKARANGISLDMKPIEEVRHPPGS